MEAAVREIIFHSYHFFEFYSAQNKSVQDKIDWVFMVIKTSPQVSKQYLKHVEGTKGLYEIRVDSGSNTFRIFSFFDKGKLIVLLNGFQKKSMKLPKKEIKKALILMNEYYEERRISKKF